MEDLYPHVRAAFYGQPWAIERAKFDEIHALLQLRAEGRVLTREQIEATMAVSRPPETLYAIDGEAMAAVPSGARPARGAKVVSVIGIYGTMLHRVSPMAESSGIASTEKIQQRVRAAANDPAIRAIVLDVDSPGGAVTGVPELAAEIRAARQGKAIVAVFNGTGASAAYWAASAADERLAIPSARVGSIGVFFEHEDRSEQNAKEGRRYTTIAYGSNKGMGGPNEPLSDAAREAIEKMVHEAGVMFEDDVAENLGISRAEVHDGFGQGLVFGASEAKSRGMIDRIGSIDDAIRRAAAAPLKGVQPAAAAGMAAHATARLEAAARAARGRA